MTRSVTVTDTGDPIAVPNVCWKNSPLYARYVVLRQKDRRVWISVGESEERSTSEESFVRQSPATLTARSTGNFVKRDVTLKETRSVFGGRVCLQMKSTKSEELVTFDSDFPTRGGRMDTRCLES